MGDQVKDTKDKAMDNPVTSGIKFVVHHSYILGEIYSTLQCHVEGMNLK